MCAAPHTPSSAVSALTQEGSTALTVDHVGISVADLASSVAFYSDVFDLVEEFRFTVEESGLSAVVLRSASGWGIELLHRADSVTPARWSHPDDAVRGQGYGHLCLRIEGDLDDVYARFLAAGGREVIAPRIGPHPQVLFSYAADPEGNLVEMIRFLADFQ